MFVSLNGDKTASSLFFMVNLMSANTDKDFIRLLSVDGLVNSKRVCHNGVVQRNKGYFD
jgi:hypothetical protein